MWTKQDRRDKLVIGWWTLRGFRHLRHDLPYRYAALRVRDPYEVFTFRGGHGYLRKHALDEYKSSR